MYIMESLLYEKTLWNSFEISAQLDQNVNIFLIFIFLKVKWEDFGNFSALIVALRFLNIQMQHLKNGSRDSKIIGVRVHKVVKIQESLILSILKSK